MNDIPVATTKLEALLASAVDAIITIDKNAGIQSINPAAEKLFGYVEADLKGKNVKCLMPEPWASKHDHYMRNYQTSGVRKIIGVGREVDGLRKDGSTFPMHLAVSEYVVDGDVFYTGIIHDLTKRKQTEAALLRAQKMEAIGQLTGGVAHDFNNILTIITGNLELLQMRMNNPKYVDLLNEALEAAELGAGLTARLLAFARKSVLEPKIINLNTLVENMHGLLCRTLGEHIELRSSFEPRLNSTKVDPVQVESAILNLAVNARDAMPEGGYLAMETSNTRIDEDYALNEYGLKPGSYVCISVSDTGYGMTKEVHARAFEPFFSTKELGSGSGLGLSMVYGFAKQSNGHVTIYSELGHGTTINIYLPVHAGEGGITPQMESTRIEDIPSGNGQLILVVEDDERVREVTIRRLEALNYSTLVATTGDEAIKVLKETSGIDAVFTDLVMPGKTSGYDLAEYVRAEHPSVRVLLTSGYAADVLQSDELAKNALNLLRKPYKQADLARIIHVTLS